MFYVTVTKDFQELLMKNKRKKMVALGESNKLRRKRNSVQNSSVKKWTPAYWASCLM